MVGGDDPQLLGDEADRDRQQRVEVEEAARGPVVGEVEDAGEQRVGEREHLARAQGEPELPAGRDAPPALGAEESDQAAHHRERERAVDGYVVGAHPRDIERFATK